MARSRADVRSVPPQGAGSASVSTSTTVELKAMACARPFTGFRASTRQLYLLRPSNASLLMEPLISATIRSALWGVTLSLDGPSSGANGCWRFASAVVLLYLATLVLLCETFCPLIQGLAAFGRVSINFSVVTVVALLIAVIARHQSIADWADVRLRLAPRMAARASERYLARWAGNRRRRLLALDHYTLQSSSFQFCLSL